MHGTGQDESAAAALAVEANVVGLVTSRELAGGQVQVHSLTPRGSVWAVAVRGRVVGYTNSPAGRERQILAVLSGHDIAPRVLGGGADRDRLWTAAVPGRTLDRVGAGRARVCDLADLAQAWGLALARLHRIRAETEIAGPARRPWVLSGPTRLRVPGRHRPNAAQQALLRMAGSDPGLVPAVQQAADRWSERCLVHTDLAARHVLVETATETSVRFVDFSRAGVGDPDWDLAASLETLARSAIGWRVSETVLSDYFLRGYRRAGGLGQVDSRLRGLWAIEVAWRLAGGPPEAVSVDAGSSLAYWLGRARTLVGGIRPLGRAA